jgi:hypothetical protein
MTFDKKEKIGKNQETLTFLAMFLCGKEVLSMKKGSTFQAVLQFLINQPD